MEDVRRDPEAPAALESCAGEQQEAPMFVRIGGIKTGTVVQGGTVDEIYRDVRTGETGGLQGEAVFRAADGDRDLLHAEDGLQFRVSRPSRTVQRHEGIHVVPQLPEVRYQSTRDIGESAGLGVRQNLRTQDANLQCRHNLEFNKAIGAVARKGAGARRVWQAECGRLV